MLCGRAMSLFLPEGCLSKQSVYIYIYIAEGEVGSISAPTGLHETGNGKRETGGIANLNKIDFNNFIATKYIVI